MDECCDEENELYEKLQKQKLLIDEMEASGNQTTSNNSTSQLTFNHLHPNNTKLHNQVDGEMMVEDVDEEWSTEEEDGGEEDRHNTDDTGENYDKEEQMQT